MLNTIITGTEITLVPFLICTAVSLILGVLTGMLCMFRNRYSQSFVLALAVIPVMVQIVIMLVNGHIGTGVAVAGAFSLVRFRSAQGNAREISLIFLAMAIGLANGMGYVALAAIFFLITAVFMLFLNAIRFGAGADNERVLTIVIPEDLDYNEIFDDIMERYTNHYELESVKTAKMGTLYSLNYKVALKNDHDTKSFMDELRCRNGNLEITCGRPVVKELL